MLGSVAQNLEDLGHLPSRSQVHPEAGHGAPRGQADDTGAQTIHLITIWETSKRLSFALFEFVFSYSHKRTVKMAGASARMGFSSYLRHRVLRGWLLFSPVSRYSKSSVNS